MSFCSITPSRGDRPKLLDFCKQQIERMTVRPDQCYFIDHPPQNTNVDLVERIRMGVDRAIADGHQYAFILEDDDFYSPDYFKAFQAAMNRGDAFLGCSKTTYYNLKNKTWQTFEHLGRSSLFQTGFKLKSLEKFNWPNSKIVMLDLYLWAHSRLTRNNFTRYFHPEPIALGIKHGQGVCGGKAHRMELKHKDQHYAFLKSHVDLEAFKFYLTL